MKQLLSLAAALLFSLSALAMDSQPIELNLRPGSVQAQMDQYYSYNFGSTSVNFPLYVDFTLNNHGPGPLFVQRIGVGGIDFDAFHNCPGTLPPGTFCTIRVRFKPWNEGFKTGRLLIRTSDGLIQIDLAGWGRRF